MKSVEITYSFHPSASPPTPLPANTGDQSAYTKLTKVLRQTYLANLGQTLKNLLTVASRLIFLIQGLGASACSIRN
jgi:hypothetical protein